MGSISKTIDLNRPDLKSYEELYKHYHQHPELSFQEKETAKTIAKHLDQLNAYEVHPNIGGYGVAAVLKNGPGKTVLLRADIDALPVEEKSGLPYASKKHMKDLDDVEKPVMHACGHDMHITALLAAAKGMVKAKDKWSGTLLLIFQPAEERAGGAQAMIDDGLYQKIPEPDVVVGAHVVSFRAGVIGTKHGLMASSADSFRLHIPGRQAHASTPHVGVDPIVQAASTITRLQSIVSREIDPREFAVLTVSAIHAGDAENIIPSYADLKLNIRAGLPSTRNRLLTSMRRIIDSEAHASSHSPALPTLTPTTRFPLLFNDAAVNDAISQTFKSHFEVSEHGYSDDIPRLPGSEDFGILATAIGKPSCYFLYGGTEHALYDKMEKEGRLDELPGNHSPWFTPCIQPTLGVAVDGYMGAALTFLDKST